MTEYTAKEQSNYRAPSCPACGSRVTHSWDESNVITDEVRRWVPSDFRCSNSKCENHNPGMTGIPGL